MSADGDEVCPLITAQDTAVAAEHNGLKQRMGQRERLFAPICIQSVSSCALRKGEQALQDSDYTALKRRILLYFFWLPR